MNDAILDPLESPLTQTDDDPGRVSEVVPRTTSKIVSQFDSQVINLSDADGKIVIHLDIESASQRECECIIRQWSKRSTRSLHVFARPSKQGVNKRFRLSSMKDDARTE
jgi:hypothetical protein